MKSTALLIVLLLANSPFARGATIAFEQLPELVRGKNENVRAARSTHQAEEARTGYFGRSFLPSVSTRLGSEQYKANSEPKAKRTFWGIEGSVNVFRGGRDHLEGRIRNEKAVAAGALGEAEYANELKIAQKAYWGIVAVNQLLSQMGEAAKGNETNLQSSKRRAGAGMATTADALQFELHSTLIRQEIKKLELERDLLKNRLSVAIGRDDHEDIQVAAEFPHPPDHALLPAGMLPEANAGVRALKATEAAADLAQAKAGRWWIPSVDAFVGYRLPSLDDEYGLALKREREMVAGVMVSLPFEASAESYAEARAKSFEAEAQRGRTNYRVREVSAADHELRHDINLLHDLIHDADADVAKAQRFLKLTDAEYGRGVKNGPDMLGAYQRYFDFQRRRTELYREFHEAQADLNALLTVARE